MMTNHFINPFVLHFIVGEQEYANGVKGADFTVAVPRGTLVIDNRYPFYVGRVRLPCFLGP